MSRHLLSGCFALRSLVIGFGLTLLLPAPTQSRLIAQVKVVQGKVQRGTSPYSQLRSGDLLEPGELIYVDKDARLIVQCPNEQQRQSPPGYVSFNTFCNSNPPKSNPKERMPTAQKPSETEGQILAKSDEAPLIGIDFQIGNKTIEPGLYSSANGQTNTSTLEDKDTQEIARLWERDMVVKNDAPTIALIAPNPIVQGNDLFNLDVNAIDPGVRNILPYEFPSSNAPSFSLTGRLTSWDFANSGIHGLMATVDDGYSIQRSLRVTGTFSTVVTSAAAVPEPTTMGGLLLAGAIGARLRRRAARRSKTQAGCPDRRSPQSHDPDHE